MSGFRASILLLILVWLPGKLCAETVTSDALDYVLTTLTGDKLNVADYKHQKPVYLKFWATWCQPCLAQMPHLQHTYETYKNDIAMIAINIDVNETSQSIADVIDKFNLSVPITSDPQGQLATTLNLVGTPFHVLINRQGEIVHLGHDASDELDRKLAILAKSDNDLLSEVKLSGLSEEAANLSLPEHKISVLYLTATFCDWYWAETRPQMAKACVDGQKQFNQLQATYSQVNWQVILSHLWTGEKELNEYLKKFDVSADVAIDTKGELFFAYNVRHFPTVLVMRGEEILLRTHTLTEVEPYLNNH